MLLKCCSLYARKFGKLSSSHQIQKGQFHSNPKAMPKNVQLTTHLHSFHMLARSCLKILQARLQHYTNQEIPDVQAGFRKSRGTRDQIANICWVIEKARKFQKNTYFCFIDYTKAVVWITTNCGKSLKRWENQTTLPASRETYMLVKEQQSESDIEKRTGSKLGKEYIKAIYCHPACLSYMQSTSCEMLGWMRHKLESRLPGEISVTSDVQITPLLWLKVKRN